MTDYNYANKNVLLRLDLNIPMDLKKNPLDLSRVNCVLPTINFLRQQHAKIIILSHFGRPRPNHDRNLWDLNNSLRPIAKILSDQLGQEVIFIPECIGSQVKSQIDAAPKNAIIMLENLRFYLGEENNDDDFSNQLAALGDLYINDAFSCSHRAHASMVGLAKKLPAAAGMHMHYELTTLQKLWQNPQRPLVGIIGGSKISSKIAILQNFIKNFDVLLIGGAMANTFLKAKGFNIGKSMVEDAWQPTASEILNLAKNNDCKIILPIDGLVANYDKLNNLGANKYLVKDIEQFNDEDIIFDIGPKTVQKFKTIIDNSKTILWNGPLGAFDIVDFAQNTLEIAKHLAKKEHIYKIVGGGETVAALAAANVQDKMTFVSTAGGAFLELLEGKILPGVQALQRLNK